MMSSSVVNGGKFKTAVSFHCQKIESFILGSKQTFMQTFATCQSTKDKYCLAILVTGLMQRCNYQFNC